MPIATDPNTTSTCKKCTDHLSIEDAVRCEGNCLRWFKGMHRYHERRV